MIHSKPKLHTARWSITGWGGGKHTKKGEAGKRAYAIERCSYPGCGKVRRKKI